MQQCQFSGSLMRSARLSILVELKQEQSTRPWANFGLSSDAAKE